MLDGHLDGEISPFTVPSQVDDGGKAGRIGIRQLWRRPWRQSSQPARLRVFIYSHDTFGLGHLRRNLAIAEHLLGRNPGFEVLLLTGSPVIRSWDLPPGLSVQPLPPVVKVGPENYAARSGNDPFAMVKGYREALILKSVLRGRPDVLLVDHAPAGMRGELLPTLSLMRRELPATRVVVGLRDILDSPDVVRKLWQEEDTYALLERAYDDIFVYGSRELFDVVPAYGIPETTAAKLRYVGHIGRPLPSPNRTDQTAWPGSGIRVLVTTGGGGDGMFLMDAYLRALKMLPPGVTQSLLVTGPLMPLESSEALYAHAVGRTDITIRSHTTDLPRLMADADLVVSMGGYNTCVEILAARKKAIIVPRAGPRAEQLMRAAMLDKLGLAWTAAPGPGLAERLAQLLPDAWADRRARPPVWEAIDLEGARRVGDLLSSGIGAVNPAWASTAAGSAS